MVLLNQFTTLHLIDLLFLSFCLALCKTLLLGSSISKMIGHQKRPRWLGILWSNGMQLERPYIFSLQPSTILHHEKRFSRRKTDKSHPESQEIVSNQTPSKKNLMQIFLSRCSHFTSSCLVRPAAVNRHLTATLNPATSAPLTSSDHYMRKALEAKHPN